MSLAAAVDTTSVSTEGLDGLMTETAAWAADYARSATTATRALVSQGGTLDRKLLDIAFDMAAESHHPVFHRHADMRGIDAGLKVQLFQHILTDA